MLLRKLLIIPAAFTIAAVCSLAQQTNKVDELIVAQKWHQDQLERIEERFMGAQGEAVAEYGKQLVAVEQALTRKGDLDGVIAVRQERDRFKKAGELDIPDDAIVKTPVELNAAQMKFRTAVAKIMPGKQAEKTRQTSALIDRLETLKQNLTKSGRIEDAVVVRDEIEKTRKALESLSGFETNAVRAAAVKCPACSGAGVVKKVCTNCQDGLCSACNGAGYKPGLAGVGPIPCIRCSHTGKCPSCKGTRLVDAKCDKCSGTGMQKE